MERYSKQKWTIDMLPPGEPQNTLCSVKEATQETTYSINAFTGNVNKNKKRDKSRLVVAWVWAGIKN